MGHNRLTTLLFINVGISSASRLLFAVVSSPYHLHNNTKSSDYSDYSAVYDIQGWPATSTKGKSQLAVCKDVHMWLPKNYAMDDPAKF